MTMIRDVLFDDIIGQENAVEILRISSEQAAARDEPLGHTIIRGPSGHGKTTLAFACCNMMDKIPIVVNGGSVKKIEDITPHLARLREGDVIFIDEIHRLAIRTQEFLYTAMEDYYINVSEKKIRIDLPKWTLIGATTSEGDLSEPFLNRFVNNVMLQNYDENQIADIIKSYCDEELKFNITHDAAILLSAGSRLVPRVARHACNWARDYAGEHSLDQISYDVALNALEMRGINKEGLTNDDLRYLKVLQQNWPSPVGLRTLAKKLQMDTTTIENVIEPFLLRKELINCTSSGRIWNSDIL
jgi:Holliday junction DNA helicase RuvB